jgi:hypothetical protein
MARRSCPFATASASIGCTQNNKFGEGGLEVRGVEAVIAEYLAARNRLLALAARHPELLTWNDNIIGRIGEYLAISFLTKKRFEARGKSSRSPRRDTIYLSDQPRSRVKLLTSENVKGRGMRLSDPWDELLVLEGRKADKHGRCGWCTS